MAERYPAVFQQDLDAAVDAAARAITRGELVVLPTDTVYGIGADAFDPAALDALAVRVPVWARALTDAFWPGALTLVCHQQSSLRWDLGETRGTVAVRVPDHAVAIAVLERTGPLAVSSANRTGMPAATDAAAAEAMLGHAVSVVVDGGPTPAADPSTIVDATSATPRLLRLGAISVERLDEVLAPFDVSITEGD